MDLYLHDPVRAQYLDLAAAAVVVDQIGHALGMARPPDVASIAAGPVWLEAPGAEQRFQVWIALGMVNVALHYSTTDALALLRAYSYSHDLLLDDVAGHLVTRTLRAEELHS